MTPIHTAFALSFTPTLQNHSLVGWCTLATQALTSSWTEPTYSPYCTQDMIWDYVRKGVFAASSQGSASVRLLRNSQDPIDCVSRWNLVNERISSRFTTQLVWDGPSHIVVKHSRRDGSDSPHSRLLVTAALCTGLSQIGVRAHLQGLTFEAGQVSGDPPANFGKSPWVIELTPCSARKPLIDAPARIRPPPKLESVIHALQAEPGREWSLEHAAQQAYMSTRSFQRTLSTEGITWPWLVRSIRLEAASQQILNTRVSLTRLAHELGFSDSAHLSRNFQAAAGMSPSVYRTVAHGRSRWRGLME